MRPNLPAVLRLVATLALLVLFLASGSALAQSVANGRSLYVQYCQLCHGNPPIAGPDRAANNPGLIRNAINNKVPDMRTLIFLTDANLADIAAWIASLSAPVTPPVPALDYTDLWYGGEAESGWGLNIIQHPSHAIFAVMYTYDANGRPIWFVMAGGTWTSTTTYAGAWYRVTGTPYDRPWAGNDVRQVGTATITFTGPASGTLSYVVNGTVVTKSITRQPF